jgi:hypothetical protein
MNKQYLAGFFDASGNILLYKRKDKRARRGFTYNLTVSMIRVNKKLLTHIKSICKTKIVIVSKKKEVYRIQIQNLQGAKNLLEYLKADVVSQKRLVKTALRYCRSRLKEQGYSTEEISITKKIARMKG